MPDPAITQETLSLGGMLAMVLGIAIREYLRHRSDRRRDAAPAAPDPLNTSGAHPAVVALPPMTKADSARVYAHLLKQAQAEEDAQPATRRDMELMGKTMAESLLNHASDHDAHGLKALRASIPGDAAE